MQVAAGEHAGGWKAAVGSVVRVDRGGRVVPDGLSPHAWRRSTEKVDIRGEKVPTRDQPIHAAMARTSCRTDYSSNYPPTLPEPLGILDVAGRK